ncbi:hypothetical protein G9A89_008040 [Geosiphon pyriformis]|nr:hypothetical protein G9A89_008040 [Geosiphon pyriformis]
MKPLLAVVLLKKKSGVLKDSAANKLVLSKKAVGGSWGFEVSNTTKSDSVDIKKECLVEKTSVEYGEKSLFMEDNSNQMLKSLRLVTIKVLSTPLKKINFLDNVDDDDILLDTPATEKTRVANILVNTNLKKSTGHSNWTVVVKKIPIETLAKAIYTALSEFGIIKSIKMQLDFVQSVNEKTCVIDYYPVIYAQVRCAVVCFNSAESLDVIIRTISVLRDTNLYWFSLVSARCAKCRKSDHISLSCVKSGKVSFGSLLHRVLSDVDKSRLAVIYAKQSAPVACPVFFDGFFWAKVASGSSSPLLSGRIVLVNVGFSLKIKSSLPIATKINDRFATLECSLASLTEHVDMLAKRLKTLEPMVSQLSPKCQLLVNLSSQNQGVDIVMSEGSSVVTSGETVVRAVVFNFSIIRKMENTLKNLAIMVMSFLAKIDNAGFFGTGMVIILNDSLTHHVAKIEEVPGHFISIRLLFKDKLLVAILGLYAGAFAETRFSQFSVINFFIAKAVNSFTFVVLGEDFNKNGSRKSASFKFCSDLGLVNAFNGHLLVKASTWGNSKSAMKVIDYIFVSKSLLSAVASHKVISVSDFFDTDYNAVMVSIGLDGLLDIQLNSL